MPKDLSPESKAMARRLTESFSENSWDQAEVAVRLDYERSIVNKYINARQKISDIFLRKLEEVYGLSRKYIKTGEGPKKISHKPASSPTAYLNEPVPDYAGRTDYNITRQISSDKPNMWMVPIKAQAGFAKGFEGRTFAGQIQRVAWPLIQGECFCFEVEGLSMFPTYLPHSWVICTILTEWEWLRHGKSYVFQTYEGVIIKRFDRIDSKFIYLNSINSDSDPVPPIPLSELRMIYAIDGKYTKE